MTFLNHEKPLKTVMIENNDLNFIYKLIADANMNGADAFGLQVEKLLPEDRNKETYQKLFAAMGKPVYVTNYAHTANEGKTYDEMAEHLLLLAESGATLIDVMGDYFDKHPIEFTEDPAAIEKQKKLIADLHAKGAEVIMSSHVKKFISAEEVLKIARGHQERGADICKIVTWANTPEEEAENLRIIGLLKKELEIPFLYLAGGSHQKILRRIGPMMGCCMWLCVQQHTNFSTKAQPLLSAINAVCDGFNG